MTITDEQLKRWRALADAATPGPGYRSEDESVCAGPDGNAVWVGELDMDKVNEPFVLEARTAVPALLDEVARLRAELRNVLASAHPNKRHHPTMFAAWESAEALLTGTEKP